MNPTRVARRNERCPHAMRLPLHRSLIAGLVAAALGVAASPARALPVFETEPNDTFPGQTATVATLYRGQLCTTSCGFQVPPDLIDLYHYSGLSPGLAFNLTGIHLGFSSGPDFVFGLYTDQTTVVNSATAFNVNDVVHLFGIVPLSGELSFGVTTTGTAAFEGYSLTLNVAAAPEPATLALLAVGLAGALVTRRRKRS